MKYSLAVPFTERFFELTLQPRNGVPDPDLYTLAGRGLGRGLGAGYVGMITANSFMKREFGSKFIEQFLPRVDLTHVIDTSGAYIPGHNGHGGKRTPTVILFGRDRRPVGDSVRTVMGIKGEPTTPEDPVQGLVWRAIVKQVDRAGSETAYVSVTDTPRATFATHPWSIGGGGATELLKSLNSLVHGFLKNKIARRQLVFWIGDREVTREVLELGFASFTGADEVLLTPASSYKRAGIAAELIRQIIIGDSVRDWMANAATDDALVPYDADQNLLGLETNSPWGRFLWPYRVTLSGIVSFNNQTKAQLGDPWWAWYRWVRDRYLTPFSITFAFVATHSHFVFDRGGKVFSRTAPVIKLPSGTSEDAHLGLVGLLNSSIACFWGRQIFFPRGGFAAGKWEECISHFA